MPITPLERVSWCAGRSQQMLAAAAAAALDMDSLAPRASPCSESAEQCSLVLGKHLACSPDREQAPCHAGYRGNATVSLNHILRAQPKGFSKVPDRQASYARSCRHSL